MKRKPTKDEKGGYRGNTYEENFDNRTNPIGAQVGIKSVTLKDSGRKVLFIYNNEPGAKKGKHIGMVKESLRGNSNYSKADLEEMADLRMTNMADEIGGQEETVTEPTKPIVPADVKVIKPKVVLGQPSRDDLRTSFIKNKVQQLKDAEGYDKDLTKFYDKIYGEAYDKLNPIQNEQPKGSTTSGEESTSRTDENVNEKDVSGSQEKKVRKGKTRKQQGIKNQDRLDALKLEVFSPKAIIMQHFIGGGKISKEAVISFYKGSKKEANVRSHMVALTEKHGKSYAPNFDDLAHDLWEANKDLTPNAESTDYKNALEEVVQEYTSVVQMAQDLLAANTLQEEKTDIENIVTDGHKQAEAADTVEELDEIQSEVEKLGNDELDKWEDNTDINSEDKDVPFQKQSFVKGDITKIVEKLKSAMPKMKVVYDENLKVAGKVKGDTITINPYAAGLDTPIHEYGHVLIDAIGYNNKVIQVAIKQLKSTDLWKETEKRYPELDEENLGKEVLAEAIGREGADIFEKEADKSKFKTYLDYIFDWLKTKLGLNKNIAICNNICIRLPFVKFIISKFFNLTLNFI